MAGVFGFSVGDILACGKLCHQIYKACFSDSADAISSWKYLGRELYALGTALKTLSTDDNIIPSDIHMIEGDPERLQKEQRALEAVRMVVGDFKETLRELEAMLLKYSDFRKAGAGGAGQYWLKVRFTVNSGDLDKFRAKIAMHTRAVNLLLNPLIYQQMKGMQTSQHNIQTSVSNIQTRIDTIDQVLHALLFVASEQLTSNTPRIPSSSRISGVELDGDFQHPQGRYMIEASPANVQTMPSFLSRAENMGRSASHQPERQTPQSGRLEEVSIRRRTTEPHENIKPLAYKSSLSRPDRRLHDHLNPTDHDDIGKNRRGSHNGGSHSQHTILSQLPPTALSSPPQKSKRKQSVDSVKLDENPIDAALRKQVESNEAQDIPIEHWITAAMHWYFKAQGELEEVGSESHEVPPGAYLGLMKSTWIVENVIREWDSKTELPEEIRINVETLIALIVEQFGKIEGKEMPNIRHLKKPDFEIWHKDIKGILIEPSSPLASSTRTFRREETIRQAPSVSDEERQSRRQSVSSGYSISSSLYPHRVSVRSPDSDREESPVRARNVSSLSPRLDGAMPQELSDWDHWSENIFASISSPTNQNIPINLVESEPSPGRDTFHEWPSAGESSSDKISGSLPVGNSVLRDMDGSPRISDPESYYRVRRSASASTASTGSSGQRESFSIPSSYRSGPVPIPTGRQLPPIIRRPVPTADLGLTGLHISGVDRRSRHSSISEVDESEFGEMVGERLVLDTISVNWAARSSGPFTKGTLKVFWHQSHEYFRLLTTWSSGRSNSQDIPLRDMELIPSYAYDEDPTLFFRKSSQRVPASGNIIGTSPSGGIDMTRKGYIYRFHSSEDMLKFQTALTGEDVYQDLVKRVSAVKLKRSTEKSGHTYHSARLQLWHEKPPADSLLPDTASGLTGVSQATRVKLSLQWSRLVIYLGGSDCFITCFVTDDITLKRDGNKLSLVPTKYSAKDVFKSPKYVKAMLIGGDHAKGGIRLDKDKISSNDEHSFDDFSYIQITFKETLYLNKFETLWNQMMDTRRTSRTQIRSLQRKIERTTYAPGYDT